MEREKRIICKKANGKQFEIARDILKKRFPKRPITAYGLKPDETGKTFYHLEINLDLIEYETLLNDFPILKNA